jgi:serine phosphatase RsbU (regulator of sigma subunit)
MDKSDNIWIGTDLGLSKVTSANVDLVQNLNQYSSEDLLRKSFFYNYGYNDGFLGLQCRPRAVYEEQDGKIWWGADKILAYHPDNDRPDTRAPVTELTRIKLYGEDISWTTLGAIVTDSTGHETISGKIKETTLPNGVLLKNIYFKGVNKWYHLPEELSLPYNNNYLTFAFAGVHLQSKTHVRYQYKLEGLDNEWSAITKNTEAVYGNLPAGNYSFKVKSMNQSGVWSAPTEYNFEVRPPWWATWWFRILLAALIISSAIFYIKRREYKLRLEKEMLEKTVELRTKEVVEEKRIVERQKNVVEAQKHIIEEKHKEITDSINYAERIQKSFLATRELLNENLKDHFVYFQPKDVVSGDFYWASKLNNGQFALATAASTGHGVPGAIMSLLNITSLEKAIEHQTSPSAILNETRKIIIDRLKKDGSPEGGKDGMDCSLISFDFPKNKLTYAAANNSVWIVRENELIELDPDKMPVGKHDKDTVPFTQREFEVQKGDVIYTLTDGLPDQFGGPKGKKYMYKRLKEYLISISKEPMDTQKQKLQDELNSWKGNLEQVDDVTVIGVRIS